MATRKGETKGQASPATRPTTGSPARRAGGLHTLREDIDRLFDRFASAGSAGLPVWAPWERTPLAGHDWLPTLDGGEALGRTDVSETEDGYELEIDLPGMTQDDVAVEIADGALRITGERRDEREHERKGYHLSERSYGSVARQFPLPDGVDPDGITAHFRDGVLTISLPKSPQAQANRRQIPIGGD